MTSGTTAHRATEVFADALEQARAGRMTMAEVCAQLGTSSKTIKYHIGKGWISGAVENIGGKEMWLFEPDAVARYIKIRAENEGRALQAGRRARGGAKLAEAPPGFVTLIDVAAQTGHSMDFMRAAAPRLGFETFRGPKRVFMVRAEDVPRLIEAVAATPPRPGRQKKAGIRQKIVWTPEMDSALGKEPDGILAGRWGISPAAVQQRRVKMGVEAVAPPDPDCRSKFGKHIKWTQEMLGMLGKDFDTVLAKKWGISSLSVFLRRKKLGIPAFLSPKNHFMEQKIMPTSFPASLRAKIEEAKPLLLNKLSDLGVTLPDVTDEQVIGYALDQVIRQAAAAERGREAQNQ